MAVDLRTTAKQTAETGQVAEVERVSESREWCRQDRCHLDAVNWPIRIPIAFLLVLRPTAS